MPVVEVSMAELARRLKGDMTGAVERVTRAVQITVRTEGPRIVQEVIGDLIPLPVDRGTYRRGWQAADMPGGAVLFNPVLYAPIIEFGRRAGKFPPVDAIAGWVKRKGLVKGVTGKQRANAIKGIAFVIARKIAKQGSPARRVLLKTNARLTAAVMSAVERAFMGLPI